jgi:L-ascorbate metabolism protein UlaG (beta-lactamase superfamily)
MKRPFIPLLILAIIVIGYFVVQNGDAPETTNQEENNQMQDSPHTSDIGITPISHASLVLDWEGHIILADPVGGAEAFSKHPSPSIILLTDIHGDHLSTSTLESVAKADTIIVAPQAVADLLPTTTPGTIVVLKNGEKSVQKGFSIEAVPMYNVPESETSLHAKGRGNGYVVENAGKRVYISGDTSNTPEMRELKNIDIAFVCMNLPYTMGVEEAAQAVLAFKPKRVIPYHYRGQEGLSDTNKFKELVNAGDQNIQVDLMDFYPNEN